MSTKIINLKEGIDSEWEIRDINALGADLFIYSYEYGIYEGSGFAVWKKGKDWFYSSLGHCSCDGPTSFLYMDNKAVFTWEQVKEIANKENYNNHAEDVIKYIIENKYV